MVVLMGADGQDWFHGQWINELMSVSVFLRPEIDLLLLLVFF